MFHKVDDKLLFKSTKENDPRIGELIVAGHTLDQMHDEQFIICGYPDDEGIALNQGRLGAQKAPDKIRKHFYKMSPRLNSKKPKVFDIGNIDTSIDLEQRHNTGAQVAKKALSANKIWIGLGGGHDYAYADGKGFLDQFKRENFPLIINFDAHLDVRSTSQGLSSGTPFFRLMSEYDHFEFLQIGIQSQCNSQTHYDWCLERNVKVLTMDEILSSQQSIEEATIQFLKPYVTLSRPVYLSIDIDGFASSEAMGCSQSWPTGFTANSFMKVLNYIQENSKVKTLGIYEVSPPLDQDNRTSKLAAQIIHRFIFNEINNG